MKKRVILSAGGTGGHLFPAQSLANRLSDWDVLFVAGGLSNCLYFDQQRFAYEEISCTTFSFSQPLQVLKGSRTIYKGVRQSRKILRTFKPHLVVGFGSFFTLPALIAAASRRVPIVLHEQNAIPGKVNRLVSRFAHTTAITFPHSRKHIKGRSVEVTFPLRSTTGETKEMCWEYFGLQPGKPTLLVFGGSQGAVRLNTLILDALDELLDIQVLHFTGHDERTREAKKRYQTHHIPACVKSFEPNIDRAMQIADLAVTRAGASTISELIEYELPALLVPYPFATDNHQVKNGEHFVEVMKGGEMLLEKELTSALLALRIRSMMNSSQIIRNQMNEYKKKRNIQGLDTLIKDIIQ